MAGARKRSLPEEFKEGSNGERYATKNFVDHIEYETYYPRLMLEQRMNRNIEFRVSDKLEQVDEWDSDLNAQMEMLTAVSESEKDRLLQQSLYFVQNKNLFEIQANRDESILEEGIQANVPSKNISIIHEYFQEPNEDYSYDSEHDPNLKKAINYKMMEEEVMIPSIRSEPIISKPVHQNPIVENPMLAQFEA